MRQDVHGTGEPLAAELIDNILVQVEMCGVVLGHFLLSELGGYKFTS